MILGIIPGMIIIGHIDTAAIVHILTEHAIMILTGLVFIVALTIVIIMTHGMHGAVIRVMDMWM